jgi:DNA-binding Lrp family transcriptional regulator
VAGRARRRNLDEIDQALLAELRRDGRAPNVELARTVGVSEKTVRVRIARLVAEHGLRVTAELAAPGQQSRMVYLIHTEPGRRFEVAEFLAVQPGVDVVHLTTGSADVLAVASFPDDAAALRFLVSTIESHPGVRSTQSCHLIAEAGGSPVTGAVGGPQVDTEALAAVMIGPPRHANLDELTDAVCDAATTGLGADRVLVATAGADGNRAWGVAKRRGISDGYLQALNTLIDGGVTDGVIKRVWQTRLHVYVADARTDPLFVAAHDLVRAEGYVTILTLPMLYGDSLVASVSLYYNTPYALDDAYIATAQRVADSFAVPFARMTGRAPATVTTATDPRNP